MTPLKQGCALESKGCQLLNALGNVASESPHREVCAPKIMLHALNMFAIFVAKIWFQSIHICSPGLSKAYDGLMDIDTEI